VVVLSFVDFGTFSGAGGRTDYIRYACSGIGVVKAGMSQSIARDALG
jgi:hypothetical protein